MNEALLTDYLDGKLSDDERQQLEGQLARDPALRQMLDDMRQLLLDMDNLTTHEPSPNMQKRFENWLSTQQQSESVHTNHKIISMFEFRQNGWLWAAASVILLIGIGFGMFWQIQKRHDMEIATLHGQINQTQRMLVLAMLEKPSASERINAVNVLQKESPDPKIIEALIRTMNFDDMANVRMKAAHALARLGKDASVRDALIEGLSNEKSPEVQIAIIDALIQIGEKRAVPSLKRIRDDAEVMEVVRTKAASGIHVLI
jgi:HEAT repeats